jgi:hypothetical protein
MCSLPNPQLNHSNSPAPLVRLGKEKGYELICVIGPNLPFVDQQYYSLFNVPDNSLDALRDDNEVTHIFIGFNGEVLVDGPADLRWHGLKMNLNQTLPKMLRRYPPAYFLFQRIAFRIVVALKRSNRSISHDSAVRTG